MSAGSVIGSNVRLALSNNGSVARFLRSKQGLFGVGTLLVLVLVSLAAPWISPFSGYDTSSPELLPPSSEHLMGTDDIGRDVLSVMLYGTGRTVFAGLISVLIAFCIGCTVGALAGYFGGWVEAVLMRVTELFQTLPALVLALFIVAIYGSNTVVLILVISLAIWPLEARIVYGQVLLYRSRPFVDAAITTGYRPFTVIVREILPNAMPPVMVQLSLDGGLALLYQVALNFLGFGSAKDPSWGQLMNVGQSYLSTAWWISIFPGVATSIAIVGFSLIGDAINRATSPYDHKPNIFRKQRR